MIMPGLVRKIMCVREGSPEDDYGFLELVKIIHKTTPISLFDRSNKGRDRYRTADWLVLMVLVIKGVFSI